MLFNSHKPGKKGTIVIVSSFMGDIRHSGGVGRHIGLLQEAFKGTGYDCLVVDRRSLGKLPAFLVSLPKLLNTVAWPLGTLAWSFFANFFQRIAVLLRVGMSPVSGWVFEDVFSYFRTREPSIVFIHSLEGFNHFTRVNALQKRLLNVLLRRECRLAHKARSIVTVSKMYRTITQREAGLPSGSVKVIPPALDFDSYTAGFFSRPDTVGYLHLISVGILSRTKNHKFLLDLMEELDHKELDVRLTIIGDGPLKKELQEIAAVKGIASKVRFTGFCDPRPYYAEGHLFLLPSLSESFGIVLLESRAFRLVNIVSEHCKSPADLYDHKLPLDLNTWVTIIEMYYRNVTIMSEVGAKGYLTCRDNYLPEAMIRKVLESIAN